MLEKLQRKGPHRAAASSHWQHADKVFAHTQEAKRFDSIDAAWKKIMAETSRNPVVLEACGAEGRQAQLQALSEQLEACQKSLSEYIELKRCAFTRCVMCFAQPSMFSSAAALHVLK